MAEEISGKAAATEHLIDDQESNACDHVEELEKILTALTSIPIDHKEIRDRVRRVELLDRAATAIAAARALLVGNDEGESSSRIVSKLSSNKDEKVPEDLQGHQLTLTIHDEIEDDPQEYESSTESNESSDSERPRNGIGFEVLRCIVNGGQDVSVTALGLTTAASASGMAARNIMAIGFAAACTGAISFYNTMWELHQGRVRQVDKYVDTYGRRERYKLHAIVSIVSYFLFCLWPPVAYCYIWPDEGVILRTTKAVAVSLICTIALTLGKAYVERTADAFRVVKRFITLAIVSAVIMPILVNVLEPVFQRR